MDIEEAKAIYWQVENCYESDCFGEYEHDCKDCDYFVTEEEYKDALKTLISAGVINEEGELM